MSRLKALLFDVDGTLADTERDGHRPAFNAAFREAGLDWEWDEATYGELLAVTGGKERIRFYLQEFLEGFRVPGGQDEDQWIAGLHKAKTRHYLKMLREGRIPLRPGVRRLIQEARQAGIVLGIATTTTPENVTYLLRATLGEDSPGWFSVIAAGDVVPAKKPAPDIYHWALDRLGLEARDCLALEDSENGIRSSRAAGLRTVITTNGYTENDDFDDADLVIDQLGEPEQPFRVVAGNAHNREYFDVDLARAIMTP